jgi:hypothetical protein
MLKNLPNDKDNEEEEDEEDDEEDEEDEEEDEEEKGQVATNPNDIDLKNMITRKNISENVYLEIIMILKTTRCLVFLVRKINAFVY